ncbi:MAG: hypothetical protein KGI54_18035 [Pseudomonadota bacterium]|nr:hypothetical protein [Pseudomonadota bacterium]
MDNLIRHTNAGLHHGIPVLKKNDLVMSRIEQYLLCLQLNDTERFRIRQEVLERVNLSGETEVSYGLVFSVLHTVLARLSGGDELGIRLQPWTGVNRKRHETQEKLSGWLNQQLQPPLARQPMAPLRLNRSWRDACRRLLTVLGIRRGTPAVRRALQG